MRKKVLVAMSGGIDSSVAAALLKRAGFDIVGVFMRFWSASSGAEKRVRRVAKILKIPFSVFNFEKEFKKKVVDYFLTGYKKGETPNPCVVCNKEIKFGLLLEKALKLDANFIATGHYARIKKEKNGFHLLKGKDKNKDQSYFLWMLNQKQLKRVLFPIGNYTRAGVENLARKFKLPVSKTRKSVEVCFIQTTINDFLRKYLKAKPGKILTKNWKVIGKHRGLWFYTIGQRKGIELPGGPYFVLDKDLKKNLLIVTKNERDLYKKELICKNVNWISGKEPNFPLKIKAKIRYRHRLASATISHQKSGVYSLKFKVAQRAITPGQSVVFYKGQEVLGGGIIC